MHGDTGPASSLWDDNVRVRQVYCWNPPNNQTTELNQNTTQASRYAEIAVQLCMF